MHVEPVINLRGLNETQYTRMPKPECVCAGLLLMMENNNILSRDLAEEGILEEKLSSEFNK